MRQTKKLSRMVLHNWRGYLLAIGLVALATWLKYLAQPNIIPSDVPILYILAIIPTAIFFGFGPAILVCILSLLAYDYFFIPPLNHISFFEVRNAPILVIFLLVGILFSALTSNLRRKNEEALKEIAARKQSEAELEKYRAHLEELVKQRTTELEKANSDLKLDIIERHKAEEALKQSEQRWATTLMSIGDAVIAADVTGRITFMNTVAQTLTGWTLQEVSTRPITDVFNIINEYTRQTVDNPIARVLQQGTIVGLANHTILIRKDGMEVAIDDSGAPIKTQDGKTTGVVLIFRDITERKQLEEALSYERDKLGGILNSMEDGVYIVNRDYDIEYINPSIKSLFGPVESQKCYRYFHNRPQICPWCKNSEIFQGKHVHWELPFSKTGRVYDMVGTPLRNPDGRLFVQEILHDITDRKQAEYALSQRTAELVIANKELEAFSYSVSHDLRAPLRSIDGFSQAVLEDFGDKLDEQGKDYLNRIRESSQMMAQLIDDILGLSRVVRVELVMNKVNLTDIARVISQELKITGPERQVEFNIMEGVEAVGDANLLHSVLQNLLSNAFKFTAKCKIARIRFGKEEKNGENVYYVRDNGAGFDMKYADKLFKPFQRLHPVSEFSGTGIGLATVQRIVRRHGGNVWAEGEVGKGASFNFTLNPEREIIGNQDYFTSG